MAGAGIGAAIAKGVAAAAVSTVAGVAASKLTQKKTPQMMDMSAPKQNMVDNMAAVREAELDRVRRQGHAANILAGDGGNGSGGGGTGATVAVKKALGQ